MSQSAHTEAAQHQSNNEQRETVRDPLESGLNSAIGTFQRMSDKFSKMWGFTGPHAQEMTRRSSQNIEAVSQAGTILTKGAQEVSRQWVRPDSGALREEPRCDEQTRRLAARFKTLSPFKLKSRETGSGKRLKAAAALRRSRHG